MGFNKITAAEAAALIQNGDTIGLSGFTPAGVPKSVPAEIARKAEKEHAEGKEFKINILYRSIHGTKLRRHAGQRSCH